MLSLELRVVRRVSVKHLHLESTRERWARLSQGQCNLTQWKITKLDIKNKFIYKLLHPKRKHCYLLRLRSAGMFSNVNEVVEQIRLAENGSYSLQLDWSESCYREESSGPDVWGYYFEPLNQKSYVPLYDKFEVPRGVCVACTKNNIVTPRLIDGKCDGLLLPLDRYGANSIINEHIKLKSEVRSRINAFRESQFSSRMIGVHIRGPGRVDGGVPALRKHESNEAPMDLFYRQIEKALLLLPDAGIFACSDSSKVMQKIESEYGERE